MVTGADHAFDSRAAAPGQAFVYRQYLYLRSLAPNQPSLAGNLVLSIGFRQAGAEAAIATAIAQGAFLGVDPDAEWLKAAVRSGACDFVVNTLDESLRVLKNEIRKGSPVSVGLIGSPATVLREAAERGLQPDWIAAGVPPAGPTEEALDRLLSRGAVLLDLSSATAQPAFDQVVWRARSPQAMRRVDQLALKVLPEDDDVRRGWLIRAPAYFSRMLPLERVISLSSEQRLRLLEELQRDARSPAGTIAVQLEWTAPDGAPEAITL